MTTVFFPGYDHYLDRKHQLTHALRALYRKNYPKNHGLNPDQADEHVIRYYYLKRTEGVELTIDQIKRWSH